MPANPWDTGGDYYPDFIEQGYQGAIRGGAAGGLRYAPTDEEMETMRLLILAVVVTAGAAAVLAPAAAGAAGAAGAGATGAGAGVAGGATAAAGTGAAVGTGVAAGAGAAAGTAAGVGGSAAGTVAAGATGAGAATGSQVAFSVLLPEVAVVGQSAAVAGAGTGIAALAPIAVGVAGGVVAQPLPETLPTRGSTTLESGDSMAAREAAERASYDELLRNLGGNTPTQTPASPSPLSAPSLGTQAIPGFLENLFSSSTPQVPYDRTEGAKFRPQMSYKDLQQARKQVKRERRQAVRRPNASKLRNFERPSLNAPISDSNATILSELSKLLERSGTKINDAVGLLRIHSPVFAQRYPSLWDAAKSLPGIVNLPSISYYSNPVEAVEFLASTEPIQALASSNIWDPDATRPEQSGYNALNGFKLTGTYEITIRTFLPYEYVEEPVDANAMPYAIDYIDEANVRTYPQYNDANHGGHKSQQKFLLNFSNGASSYIREPAPDTIAKTIPSNGDVNQGEVKVYFNAGLGDAGTNVAYNYSQLSPGYDIKKKGSFSLNAAISTTNPAFPLPTPAIDYKLNMSIDQFGNFQLTGLWEGFPAIEIFVNNLATGQVSLLYSKIPSDAGKTHRPKDILYLIDGYGDVFINKSGNINRLPKQIDRVKPPANLRRVKSIFKRPAQ